MNTIYKVFNTPEDVLEYIKRFDLTTTISFLPETQKFPVLIEFEVEAVIFDREELACILKALQAHGIDANAEDDPDKPETRGEVEE